MGNGSEELLAAYLVRNPQSIKKLAYPLPGTGLGSPSILTRKATQPTAASDSGAIAAGSRLSASRSRFTSRTTARSPGSVSCPEAASSP